MTYYVSSGTLNPTHSLTRSSSLLYCSTSDVGSNFISCCVQRLHVYLQITTTNWSCLKSCQEQRPLWAMTVPFKLRMLHFCLIACSHCRHVQDKIVLSSPHRRCEHSCRQDKTFLSRFDEFYLISTQFPNSKFSVILGIFETEQLQIGYWVETRQTCLVLLPVVFTPPTRTRQDSFVLSVSAVWTSYYTFFLQLGCIL